MFTIDGLVTGFDTTSIIEGLISFQNSRIQTLNTRKSGISTQQAAFKGIEAQLVNLRSAASKLNRNTASVFDIKVAQSSDDSIITAAASTNAAVGSYTFTVNSLAQAQQIGSQSFSSTSSTIAEGELVLQVGANEATTITVDETNNTLSGIADSINSSSDDLSASVIYDQGSESYRLLLTSNHTGASNEISVTHNTSNSLDPALDFSGPAVQEATNASLTLGSGPGAIEVSYESNQVEGLIENVTLNLNSADADSQVTVTIGQDTEPAREAITDFVDEFNAVMEFIDAQTAFNSETNQASPLLGNRSVTSLQDRLRDSVIGTIAGLDSDSNRLSSIGITIDDKGRLNIDSAKLDDALAGNIEGFDTEDLPKLFGLNGTSTNSGIEFIGGSTRTQDGQTIQVDILQAAEKATVQGTQGVGATIEITSANNAFSLNLDGIASGVLTLDEGTYTPQEMADYLQSVINSSPELGSREVTVAFDNGNFQITSESYGKTSEISGISGSASRSLGFDGSESDVGQDVVGNFIVNGQTEAAVGTGRLLVGDPENEYTADLSVRVTLDSGSVDAFEIEGELSITRGFTGQIDQYLNQFLDPVQGTAKTINEDFDSRIASIDESIARVEELTEARREALLLEFANLERVIGELQSTGNFLSSQLASIQPLTSS